MYFRRISATPDICKPFPVFFSIEGPFAQMIALQMFVSAAKIVVPYFLLVAGLVMLMQSARQWALQELASPVAKQQWDEWRTDVEEGREPQADSVQRRTPKSTEPPGLVMMRDHFAICLIAAVGLSSLLYAVLVWFIRGVMATETGA